MCQTRKLLCPPQTLVLVLWALCVSLVALLLQPHQVHAETQKAIITVSISSSPGIYVVSGGKVSYTIQVKNSGMINATQVSVNLTSSPPLQLQLAGATFDAPRDWIGNIGNGKNVDIVTINLSDVKPGNTRTATIDMQVAQDIPIGRRINMWTSYTWVDALGKRGEDAGNAAPVVVGYTSADSQYVWLRVDPLRDSASTRFEVFSDRFMPGETINVWLQTTGGSLPLPLPTLPIADMQGQISFVFRNPDLLPGTYQLVARGSSSDLVGIATFTVEETPARP